MKVYTRVRRVLQATTCHPEERVPWRGKTSLRTTADCGVRPPDGFPARVPDVRLRSLLSTAGCEQPDNHALKPGENFVVGWRTAGHSWWRRSRSDARFRTENPATPCPWPAAARSRPPAPHTTPDTDAPADRDR